MCWWHHYKEKKKERTKGVYPYPGRNKSKAGWCRIVEKVGEEKEEEKIVEAWRLENSREERRR